MIYTRIYPREKLLGCSRNDMNMQHEIKARTEDIEFKGVGLGFHKVAAKMLHLPKQSE